MADEQQCQCPARAALDEVLGVPMSVDPATSGEHAVVNMSVSVQRIERARAALAAKSPCGEEFNRGWRAGEMEIAAAIGTGDYEHLHKGKLWVDKLLALLAAKDAQLAAVTRERDAAQQTNLEVFQQLWVDLLRESTQLRERAEQAEAREAVAVKALEPFGQYHEYVIGGLHSDGGILLTDPDHDQQYAVRVRHFKQAAAIVAQHKEAPKS